MTWLRDGVLILPVAWALTNITGATGAVYAQAMVGAVVGVLSALWGWRFVKSLGDTETARP
jgi:hypothetical protein